MSRRGFDHGELPTFGRGFFASPEPAMQIGTGELGGKARGLVALRDLVRDRLEADRFPGLRVYVPKMAVLATDVFGAFMEANDLWEFALGDRSDPEIALAFQRAPLPAEVVGDLRALVDEVRQPLAIRSSSRLEDALFRPFAGVYETKMVPNDPPDVDSRFRRLVEAIKLVWASTFFTAAKTYRLATDAGPRDERMAVVVQEVVGARHDHRFYPHVSAVARSWNFFPVSGADPTDGVVNLALGLGKSIVDGGSCWVYSPARPLAPPPFTTREMLRNTQLRFWAVNMGRPPVFDPTAETEYLVEADLHDADYDGTLAQLASTWDPESERFVEGTSTPGARVLDFAPLLGPAGPPLNDLVIELLRLGEEALGEAVELELAAVLPGRGEPETRCGVLQMRPMLVAEDEISIDDGDFSRPDLLLSSDMVMGNGDVPGVRDVVYVRPESFEFRESRRVADEISAINRRLVEDRRPYVLIGFGRWGSSDPWLGVPVVWGQVAGARVLVEAALPSARVEASQGAHFFHNLLSFGVTYLCVRGGGSGARRGVEWAFLDGLAPVEETALVRHVRLDEPLEIRVDGRRGRGGIWWPGGATGR